MWPEEIQFAQSGALATDCRRLPIVEHDYS
jgi:hypothetical protein